MNMVPPLHHSLNIQDWKQTTLVSFLTNVRSCQCPRRPMESNTPHYFILLQIIDVPDRQSRTEATSLFPLYRISPEDDGQSAIWMTKGAHDG